MYLHYQETVIKFLFCFLKYVGIIEGEGWGGGLLCISIIHAIFRVNGAKNSVGVLFQLQGFISHWNELLLKDSWYIYYRFMDTYFHS